MIAKASENPTYYFYRAHAFAASSDLSKAIKDYSQTIRLAPKLSEPYNYRGGLFFLKGEYDQSIADFTRSIVRNDKVPGVYFDRAKAYVAVEDHTKALADCDEAIDLNTEYVEAVFLKRMSPNTKRGLSKCGARFFSGNRARV